MDYRHFIVLVMLLVLPISLVWSEAAADYKSQSPNNKYPFKRIDHTFISNGLKCGAWLYMPDGVEKPPVIVMGHGFGGQRWMRLPAYAEKFAQRGLAVFVFDYRGFNDSEGEPRNYINPKRHLQDWKAALAYVRTLDTVDGSRLALWGTSFSGGHVIPVAAEDQHIKAIVSQVPFTDGITTAMGYFKRPRFALEAAFHGMWDILNATFTNNRHYVMIASTPDGPFGLMSTPDALPGIQKLLGGEVAKWNKANRCPASIVFTLSFYRPIASAPKVTCPALIVSAEKDSLFPPDGPEKMADRMPNATLVSLPIGHFEPYVGEIFDTLSDQMADFFETHLGPLNG